VYGLVEDPGNLSWLIKIASTNARASSIATKSTRRESAELRTSTVKLSRRMYPSHML